MYLCLWLVPSLLTCSSMSNDTANSGIDTGATGEGATRRIVDSEGATANTNATTKLS